MKRYLEIEKIVYQELEKNCFGNKKRQGYRHLFGVSTLCIAYSQYVQLDCELCAIMGLLHDYSVYKNNTSFNHAQLSSELARKMLEESLLFENEEIGLNACKKIIVACRNGVYWCDGNEDEAIACIIDCYCGNCLRKLHQEYRIRVDRNRYDVVTHYLCEDCYQHLVYEESILKKHVYVEKTA